MLLAVFFIFKTNCIYVCIFCCILRSICDTEIKFVHLVQCILYFGGLVSGYERYTKFPITIV